MVNDIEFVKAYLSKQANAAEWQMNACIDSGESATQHQKAYSAAARCLVIVENFEALVESELARSESQAFAMACREKKYIDLLARLNFAEKWLKSELMEKLYRMDSEIQKFKDLRFKKMLKSLTHEI